MGCRKNLTRLTLAERQAFVNAILQLKASGRYDTYVDQHQGAMGHGHGGPAFFPWHREYIGRFERELQAIDATVNLPYWDWTVDNLNSTATASLIWADDFMGGPGNPGNNFQVTTGPFAGWNLRRNAFNVFQFPGGGGTIANFMASLDYTTFRGIEGPHGGAHVWVGGNVGNAMIAPQDPVFWLIHANVDRLWAEWTTAKQGQPGWIQYAPTSGGPLGHNLNDTMWPWNGTTNPFGVAPWTVVPENRRPADVLDHRAVGIFYDTIDPECQPKPLIKERLPKELKEFFPKERSPKERIPKELGPKERLPKEGLPKELSPKERFPKENFPKEFDPKEQFPKERSPKEFKDIREVDPKRFGREGDIPEPFIPRELRPGLETAALNFESDVLAELEDLQTRAEALRRAMFGDEQPG